MAAGTLSETLDQLGKVLDRVPFVSGLKRDITRLRQVLYGRRAPRLLALGPSAQGRARLLNDLLAGEALPLDGTADAEGRWVRVEGTGGRVDWLGMSPEGDLSGMRAALDEMAPDLILVVQDAADLGGAGSLSDLSGPLSVVQEGRDTPAPVLLVLTATGGDGDGHGVALDLERQRLVHLAGESRLALKSVHALSRHLGDIEALSDAIVDALPDVARLEGGRALVHAREARRRVANDIVHSCSTLAVTVALTPIPLSDVAIIAPLQVAMVSALAHLSGTPWDTKAVIQWIGSVGVVGGAGLGFRWTAQQLVKLIPGAGSLVSASVAGAGTVALGRSAIAYFNL